MPRKTRPPSEPAAGRRRSPLTDVAGMLRSFHYAAHHAIFARLNRPEDLPAIERWAAFDGAAVPGCRHELFGRRARRPALLMKKACRRRFRTNTLNPTNACEM